jgi:hypothetical protein
VGPLLLIRALLKKVRKHFLDEIGLPISAGDLIVGLRCTELLLAVWAEDRSTAPQKQFEVILAYAQGFLHRLEPITSAARVDLFGDGCSSVGRQQINTPANGAAMGAKRTCPDLAESGMAALERRSPESCPCVMLPL